MAVRTGLTRTIGLSVLPTNERPDSRNMAGRAIRFGDTVDSSDDAEASSKCHAVSILSVRVPRDGPLPTRRDEFNRDAHVGGRLLLRIRPAPLRRAARPVFREQIGVPAKINSSPPCQKSQCHSPDLP